MWQTESQSSLLLLLPSWLLLLLLSSSSLLSSSFSVPLSFPGSPQVYEKWFGHGIARGVDYGKQKVG